MYQLIKTKAITQIILIITLSIFSAFTFAPEVAAQQVCCAQTAESFCQQADLSQCTGTMYMVGSCEDLSECQIGCCDLGNQGCTKTTTKVACETQGGTFLPDEECNYAQCQPVCCQIGSQFTYTTQQECNNQAAQYPDLEPTIHQVDSELACLELSTLQEKGCCTTQESCTQQTRAECQATAGTFFKEELCSNVFAPSCQSCTAQATTTCIEGSDNVWYADGCGNIETVAQTCDVAHGKICDAENSQATCIDINCAQTWDNPVVEGDGVFRYNGESWCEYDANAGPTLDLPGSRHYKHYCYRGKEYVEPCSDLRDEICIQGQIITEDNTQKMQAICKENRALDCFQQIKKETCENNQLRDCIWLSPNEESEAEFRADTEESLRNAEQDDDDEETQVTIASQEREVGNCIPIVPPGSAFWEEIQNPQCDAADLPSELTSTQAYWKRNPYWNCITGCITYTKGFATGTNTMCQAQGDCGAKYNTAGSWSKEGFTRMCDFPTWNEDGTEGEGEGKILDVSLKETEWYNKQVKELFPQCEDAQIQNPNTFQNRWAFYSGGLYLGDIDLGQLSQEQAQAWASASTALLLIGGIGGSLGAIMLYGAISAAATAATAAATGTAAAAAATSGMGPFGWIVSIILLITAAVILIIAASIKDYQATNTFDCNTWQQPSGGQYCNLCNEAGKNAYNQDIDLTANGLHDCTEYLCKSLGATCDFVPDTPDGPVCVNKPQVGTPIMYSLNPPNECYANKEGTLPTACTLQESPSGHTYTTYLGANQKVTWGISTQDYAKCRYDTERKEFESMNYYFDYAGFAKQHNKTLIPSRDIWPGETYSFYVQCQNNNEETTRAEYNVQFTIADQEDFTPPMITEYSITPGSYTPANKDAIDLTITLNEQVANGGGCKWATTNIPYQEMGNNFNCPAPSQDQTCTTTLQPIQNQTNTFYFRCEDDKYPDGNMNTQSQPTNGYVLVRTEPLEIINVYCQTEFGQECTNIESNEFALTVQTQGGAQTGKATCGIGYNNIEPAFDFFTTGEISIHTQQFTASDEYFIFCEDIAGNLAKTNVNAQITYDYTAPEIQEVYIEQGQLVLKTDEKATCKWATKDFMFIEATPFTVTGDKIHKMTATKDYYEIACQDKFQNIDATKYIYRKEI